MKKIKYIISLVLILFLVPVSILADEDPTELDPDMLQLNDLDPDINNYEIIDYTNYFYITIGLVTLLFFSVNFKGDFY